MDQTQQANSSFSFGRFLAFLKLLIVTNLFKVVLSSVLSFVVTTGVLSLIVYATNEFEGNDLVVLANVFYVGAALGVLFLIAIVCIFFAAGTFRSYNIRATAWNVVLLPATRSEKFVAHYIYACLFVPLIFIAAYLAGIALSYASSYVFGNEAIDLVTPASKMFDEIHTWTNAPIVGYAIATLFIWLLHKQTIFFTSAALVRKYPFLTGIALQFVIDIAYFIFAQAVINPKVEAIIEAIEEAGSNLATADYLDSAMATAFAWSAIPTLAITAILVAISWTIYRKRVVP